MKLRLETGAILVASLVVLLADAPSIGLCGGRDAIAASEVAANAELQASIARVARAEREEDLAVALEELRGRAAPDFSDLVPQLAIFLLDAKGEREGMAPAVIVSRLGISRAQIVGGIAPHLETSNVALRAQLENLLGAVDHGTGDAVDFSEYRAFLAERRSAPPAGLIEYMFARSPADAAATLAAIHGGNGTARSATPAPVTLVESARATLAKTGRVGEGTRAQVANALDALSRHPDWWMRCYAAAAIGGDRRLAEIAGEASLDRLANDPDERVRRALRAP